MYLYSNQEDAEGSNRLSRNLWVLLGLAETGFFVFFAVFLGTMKANYRVTFFSVVTAKTFSQASFKNAKTDEARIYIFDRHPSYNENIRNELKEWVLENFETWVEEKPDWFTERAKASIPLDMIPADFTTIIRRGSQ